MEAFVRQTLARAEEVGNRRGLSLCHQTLGAVQYLRGSWPESAANLSRSIELARTFDGAFPEALGMQRLALVETALGRYQEAYARLRAALALAESSDNLMVRAHATGRILATLAHNRLAAGDVAEATERLAEGLEAQRRFGECPSCDVLLYPAAVPIYLALGDLDQAERACRKAEETATLFTSQAWTATAGYLRGILAAHRDDVTAARSHLARALSTFEALEQPYDAACAQLALADVVARSGEPAASAAAELLRARASARFARLGIA